MLRIHLEDADLGRIRFADAPAPVMETAMLLFEMRNRPRPPHGGDGGWRDRIRGAFPDAARPLLGMVPRPDAVYFLDVLTTDAAEAFDVVCAAPPSTHEENRARMNRLDGPPLPTWLRRYLKREPEILRTLDRALRSFHKTCLAPQWATVAARFEDDIAYRTDLMLRHGSSAVLAGLSPQLHLDGMTLVSPAPRNRDVRLDGRGLVLAPSAFWTGRPVLTWDPLDQDRRVLIYAARPAAGRDEDGTSAGTSSDTLGR